MSDHSIQAVMYSEPVHYQEDGEWKEIDNTFSKKQKIKTILTDIQIKKPNSPLR
jgi:hypothetical protein